MRAQEVAYRFSLLVCGHPQDAEDVMQDALLKTYRYVSRIKEPEAFRTWLYTTVQNACLMKRRRHVGEPSHLTSIEQGATGGDGEAGPVEVEGHARPADQLVMDAWVSDRLRRALKALPPSYRMIVVLREMEGLVDPRGRQRRRNLGGEREDAAASRARDAAPGSGGRMSADANADCGAMLAGISAYLDGDLDATACQAIERHCRDCSRCAALVEGLRETIGLCREAGTQRRCPRRSGSAPGRASSGCSPREKPART